MQWPKDPQLKRVAIKAYIGLPFTVEDLPGTGGEWSNVLPILEKAGWIHRVGMRKSARPAARGRKVTLWAGTDEFCYGSQVPPLPSSKRRDRKRKGLAKAA